MNAAAAPPLYSVLPFVAMLLAIAVCPLWVAQRLNGRDDRQRKSDHMVSIHWASSDAGIGPKCGFPGQLLDKAGVGW